MQRGVLNIGITAGDPAGIGPEVALKAINSIRDKEIIPILIGRKAVFEKHHPAIFSGYTVVSSLNSAMLKESAPFKKGNKYLYDIPADLPVPAPGCGNPDTGIESLSYVDRAIDLWKEGVIDAVVTGPVSKGHIEKSGVRFTGHTEYIANKIGEGDPLMMMYSPHYRVLLASMHVPVSAIPSMLSEERILAVIRAGYESMQSIDGSGIRIAITGLDPHCGDDGAIGVFDRDVTARAVERARRENIPIEGPFAADTIFIPTTWKRYNLVIAHYHDQGLIPFKMIAFDEGVNVTIGLSIVRTSVDHGTAYDIAGRNTAHFRSMTEAILLAKRLVSNRK